MDSNRYFNTRSRFRDEVGKSALRLIRVVQETATQASWNREKLGFFATAAVEDERAAGMEATAQRWVLWRRHVTQDLRPNTPLVRIDRGNGGQQALRIRMAGALEQTGCGAGLDDFTQVHDGHFV